MTSPFDAAREKYRPLGITLTASAGEYRIKHQWDDEELIAEDFDQMIRIADELAANPPPKPPPPLGPVARNNHPKARIKRENKKNLHGHLAKRDRYQRDKEDYDRRKK